MKTSRQRLLLLLLTVAVGLGLSDDRGRHPRSQASLTDDTRAETPPPATAASAHFHHVRLEGPAYFVDRTREALARLRTAKCSAEVWELLVVLRAAERSGVHARNARPVIDVGQKVWESPAIWYAS